MTVPSPSPSLPPSREAELSRAETELTQQETRLAESLLRAATDSEALANRLSTLRQQVSQASAERPGDEELRSAGARLESASVHTGSTEDARERSLSARSEALEARRRSLEESQAALKSLQQLNLRAQQELAEAEAGLKRSEEAVAKARREREAAERAAERAQRERDRETTKAPPKLPGRRSGQPEPTLKTPVAARAPKLPSRVRMQALIDQRSDSNFYTGFSTNIDEGGIFVATVETVPRGTTVDLDFTLPGGRPLTVNGVVRWARDGNDRTPDLMPGVGVQFTTLPPEVAHAISSFVATRDPLFYPD